MIFLMLHTTKMESTAGIKPGIGQTTIRGWVKEIHSAFVVFNGPGETIDTMTVPQQIRFKWRKETKKTYASMASCSLYP